MAAKMLVDLCLFFIIVRGLTLCKMPFQRRLRLRLVLVVVSLHPESPPRLRGRLVELVGLLTRALVVNLATDLDLLASLLLSDALV